MIASERDQGLCPLFGCLRLPAELVDVNSMVQSKSQAKGVGKLSGQGQRLVDALEGLGPDSRETIVPRRYGAGKLPQGPAHRGKHGERAVGGRRR